MIALDDLIGQPFDWENKHGYNCYGLCREVCRRMGIDLPDRESPRDELKRSEYIEESSKEYERLSAPEPGCLITFWIRWPYVSHVGVMLDRFRFIHVMRKRNVCIERIDNPYWKKRIDGYFKYTGRIST